MCSWAIPSGAATFRRQCGPFRGSGDTLKALCYGATILDGFAVNGAGVDQYGENVTVWLEEVANETGSVFCSGII